MLVHAVADTSGKLSALSTMLEQKCTVTSELLGRSGNPRNSIEAIVVAADLGIVENIAAMAADIPTRFAPTAYRTSSG